MRCILNCVSNVLSHRAVYYTSLPSTSNICTISVLFYFALSMARRSPPDLRYLPSQYRKSPMLVQGNLSYSFSHSRLLFTPHHPHLTNNHHRNQNKSLLQHQYYDWQRTIPVAYHHNFHGCSWDGHFHRVMGHD